MHFLSQKRAHQQQLPFGEGGISRKRSRRTEDVCHAKFGIFEQAVEGCERAICTVADKPFQNRKAIPSERASIDSCAVGNRPLQTFTNQILNPKKKGEFTGWLGLGLRGCERPDECLEEPECDPQLLKRCLAQAQGFVF